MKYKLDQFSAGVREVSVDEKIVSKLGDFSIILVLTYFTPASKQIKYYLKKNAIWIEKIGKSDWLP